MPIRQVACQSSHARREKVRDRVLEWRGWWIILFLIPLVNVVTWILVCVGMANRFGHGGGFGVGLMLLPFIFLPMLAFSDSRYQLA